MAGAGYSAKQALRHAVAQFLRPCLRLHLPSPLAHKAYPDTADRMIVAQPAVVVPKFLEGLLLYGDVSIVSQKDHHVLTHILTDPVTLQSAE